ncbi:MAG TPA: TVP38/TMEM64 family protein [Thermoanaerobaculia bacterium]|nr:TVP38/TMEM64 family protein [Thermoanaerobaculia bacterium]
MESTLADEHPATAPPPTEAPSRLRLRPVIAALVVIIVAVALYLSPAGRHIQPAAAAAWLREASGIWWAPLVFIALYTLFNVLLVPGTILSLTAGVVWGWMTGGLWVLVASTIGSAVPYFIARSAGSEWIERHVEKRAGRIYQKLRDEGFITLLLMRLIPIVPYNVLNYAAGLAGIRPRDYLLATLIGTIPGIFIFTYLADSIAAGVVSLREAFLRILLAGLMLAALAISSRLLAGTIRKRLDS